MEGPSLNAWSDKGDEAHCQADAEHMSSACMQIASARCWDGGEAEGSVASDPHTL